MHQSVAAVSLLILNVPCLNGHCRVPRVASELTPRGGTPNFHDQQLKVTMDQVSPGINSLECYLEVSPGISMECLGACPSRKYEQSRTYRVT